MNLFERVETEIFHIQSHFGLDNETHRTIVAEPMNLSQSNGPMNNWLKIIPGEWNERRNDQSPYMEKWLIVVDATGTPSMV